MHGSIVDEICPTEVKIDLNNNKADKTNTVKPFSCQYCDKSFPNKCKMKRHVDCVHLKIKPFSCQYCEKLFSQKYNMIKHINSVHLNVAIDFERNSSTNGSMADKICPIKVD